MRRVAVVLLGLVAAAPARAQGPAAAPPDTATRPRPWYRPRYAVLQAAGGMGLVAGGVGYTFRRDQLETELLLGYVPRKYAGSALTIGTAKLLYSPYTLRLSQQLRLRPLTLGVYASYAHNILNPGEQGQYTKGYYWFSADTRFGVLLGGRLSYQRPGASPARRPRRLSAYYELGTNELYLISYVTNLQALSVADILTLGLGLKLDL